MSSASRMPAAGKTAARLGGGAVLLGVACLALPLSAAGVPTHQYRHHVTAAAARETIDARIAHLHASLMITPGEEQNWASVAQVMRANEASMQTLVAQERTRPANSLTAVQDLRAYETFSQAHVNGLKSLISSFEVLYAGMPASQQAVADQVFQKFGHKA